jgi:nitroreductase
MMKKRQFIRLLGGGTVVAAGGLALAGCGSIAPATQAWRDAGKEQADVRRSLLSSALLAPNPHNLQSWLADLRQPDTIMLMCDGKRLLPETDPMGRQIMIGQGCFLELLVIAATHYGYTAQVDMFPEGVPGDTLQALSASPRTIARVRLARSSAAADPLFAQIVNRRSNKEPFELNKPVAEQSLEAMVKAASMPGVTARFSIAADKVAALRELTWRAHLKEVTTPHTLMESVRLMRIGASEINQHRDGISLSGPIMEAGKLFGFINRESLADPQSSGFAQGLKKYYAIMSTAMGHMWLSTAGNSRQDQINSGRAYVRMNLKATELGIGMHPLSQALQEFAEMAELHKTMRQELAIAPGHTAQMLMRVGYGPQAQPKPRRALESLLQV